MIAVCRIAQPWIDVEASNQAAQMRPVRSLRPPMLTDQIFTEPTSKPMNALRP